MQSTWLWLSVLILVESNLLGHFYQLYRRSVKVLQLLKWSPHNFPIVKVLDGMSGKILLDKILTQFCMFYIVVNPDDNFSHILANGIFLIFTK